MSTIAESCARSRKSLSELISSAQRLSSAFRRVQSLEIPPQIAAEFAPIFEKIEAGCAGCAWLQSVRDLDEVTAALLDFEARLRGQIGKEHR
jgi:hypothetical protein